MRDSILLTVSVITDDDIGIYKIGELEFGVRGTCKDYLLKSSNREKLADWLLWLSEKCRNNETPFEVNEAK